MNNVLKTAPLGLLLVAVSACGDTDLGTVKSVHGEGTSRPYVICRSGNTYREVDLTDAILKQVKVGDPCPTWERPQPTQDSRDWRR